ncbi:RNA-guided endonuclease TnpB family protein [Robertmurraya andreesenii]|uniref:IS605 OrfB family transposase n=1 Tax=Anoxybacillus andreesenii TaxID=1325932 RepID=A0ABT9UYP3_9BACL|nr:RNA-guided endonuclease TnpB family protein [Robertmurraya andreesenii]MDQ0153797.1 IS605 OrfB family transposase [Robertmurraya andreesenii]
MTKQNKAFKFRLLPNKEQSVLLAKTFGCVRFVYNKMLAERKEIYEKFKDDKEILKKQKFPTPAKYKGEFPFLKEVDSLALANAQINLQTAYKNFFEGNAEFPKFKNRKAKPRYYRVMSEKLAKAGRILSKRKKGSARWNRQRLVVAKLHEKVANQRMNFLHHKSKELASNFDAVVIEDLDMKGMSQALHFGKSVHDNGWGMFTTFLSYKLKEQGKQLVKIDKWFPSTKKCSCCGAEKPMKLSDRTYDCSCGYVAERDYNSAINIKNEGIRLLALS